MKFVLCTAVLAVICYNVKSTETVVEPKVQVFSEGPGEFGTGNRLICKVSGFHPPNIAIDLMEDGKPISGADQTDLSFKKGWSFHITKHAPFTPMENRNYTCRVTHGSIRKLYVWEPNM